jgi:hypothetical protein
LRTADASAAISREPSSGPIQTPSRPSSCAGRSLSISCQLFDNESSSDKEDSPGNPRIPHGPFLPPSSSCQETGSPTPTQDASMAVKGASLVLSPLTLFCSASRDLNADAVAQSLHKAVDFLALYTVPLDGPVTLLSIGQSLIRLGALCAQDGWGHLPAVNWEGNQLNVYNCVLPMFVTQTEAPTPLPELLPPAVPMVEDSASSAACICVCSFGCSPPCWSSSQGPKGEASSLGSPPPINHLTYPGNKKKASFAKVAFLDPRPHPAASVPPSSGGSLLVALAQVFPHLSTDAIVNLYKRASVSSPSGGRKFKHPKMTTAGPTRCQVLFTVDDPTICVDFERCTCTLNNFLGSQKVNLRIELTTCAYGGWALSTNMAPTPTQVDLVQTGLMDHYWSKPSFKVEAYILASRSYLKLVDVPWFSSGRVPTTGEAIEEAMWLLAHCSRFLLAGNVCIVANSRQSDISTAFFEVWDSRSRSLACALIGRTIQFGHWTLHIMEIKTMPGVPIC